MPKEAIIDSLTVLVVDDDPTFRSRLCRAFRDRGCEADEAARLKPPYRRRVR
jgi:ActR/RegA family two-component response regulator